MLSLSPPVLDISASSQLCLFTSVSSHLSLFSDFLISLSLSHALSLFALSLSLSLSLSLTHFLSLSLSFSLSLSLSLSPSLPPHLSSQTTLRLLPTLQLLGMDVFMDVVIIIMIIVMINSNNHNYRRMNGCDNCDLCACFFPCNMRERENDSECECVCARVHVCEGDHIRKKLELSNLCGRMHLTIPVRLPAYSHVRSLACTHVCWHRLPLFRLRRGGGK